jgi:hypothetical protein
MKSVTKTQGSCDYCECCGWHVPTLDAPEPEDDKGWSVLAIHHRKTCTWVHNKGK